MNVCARSIASVTEEVAQGRTLSIELTEACLQRINVLNTSVNAVVTLNPNSKKDARRVDGLTSIREGCLIGLPFSVKDVFKTSGIRTTSSHRALASYVPDVNATAVDMLFRSGGVLIGKTNLPKLASDPQCRSPLFGVTKNPWDLSRTSGGSSGGSAVAVALGFSWLDLASDYAGSIRIPASYCGVVGFKATERRIDGDGHIPPLPGKASTVKHMLSFGFLARRVEDAGVGLDALMSHGTEASNLPGKILGRSGNQHQQLKFAFWDDLNAIPLCSRTRETLENTMMKLARAGHTIERTRPDNFDFENLWAAFGTIVGAEGGFLSNRLVRAALSALTDFSPKSQPIARGLLAGLSLNPAAYDNALRVRRAAIEQLECFLSNYDAWILPATPCVAYPHLRHFTLPFLSKIQFEEHSIPYLDGAFSCTAPFSLTGSPVLSIPCGVIDGLPVGLQFVGRRMLDQRLISICTLVEKVVGGYRPPPSLSKVLASDILIHHEPQLGVSSDRNLII